MSLAREPAPYNRARPSARYLELQRQYVRMHAVGAPELGLGPGDTFAGQSLLAHLVAVKNLIASTGAKTVLDYGAGKGAQYRPRDIVLEGRHVADSVAEYWDVDEVRCYDPGYAPHASLPEGKFGGVVSTDVLEHCPEEDLAWIVDEIFAYAERFVFLNVACFPARKSLPNGENAHVTVRPPEWWRDLVAGRARNFPALLWELNAAHAVGDRVTAKVFRGGPQSPLPGDVASVLIDGREARFRTPNDMTRWRVASLYEKEPATIEWLRRIPRGATLLDVGANVGMYAVFAALSREATVFAFEPESQNYALLNENIRMNRVEERVLAVCAGLSDAPGIVRLYLSEAVPGASCHSLGAEVGFRLEPRPAAFAQAALALRLDDLVASGDVPVPGYVKIDVDGFEHKVIHGMMSTLRDPRVRSLIIELNPALREHREVRAELEALGFRWDPGQVASAARKSGPFEGVAEHVFGR